MTQEEREILTDAVHHYGTKTQIIKTCEELAELQQAICKALTTGYMTREMWNHIAEEIADVEIMLWQLKHIYQNRDAVAEWRERKIQRLYDRMEAEDVQKTRRKPSEV